MSTTPEDPNSPEQPQPPKTPDAPPPPDGIPDVQVPGDGGSESERPLVIPEGSEANNPSPVEAMNQ